jgi:polar amino acid transport system substrate-binding protein
MLRALMVCAACMLATPLHAQPQEDVLALTADGPLQPVVDGRVGGVVAEVVRATLAHAQLRFRIEAVPWARAYREALKRPGTLVFSLARTPEREQLFRWIGPIVPVNYALYKRRGRDDVVVPSLDAARRYRIGVLRADNPTEYLRAKGFAEGTDSGLLTVNNVESCYAMLLLGRIDLFPMRPVFCQAQSIDCTKIEPAYWLHELDSELYMAFGTVTDPALAARVAASLESLRRSGQLARLTAPLRAPAVPVDGAGPR